MRAHVSKLLFYYNFIGTSPQQLNMNKPIFFLSMTNVRVTILYYYSIMFKSSFFFYPNNSKSSNSGFLGHYNYYYY